MLDFNHMNELLRLQDEMRVDMRGRNARGRSVVFNRLHLFKFMLRLEWCKVD